MSMNNSFLSYMYQGLSDEFMDENFDFIDWEVISAYQTLSESF